MITSLDHLHIYAADPLATMPFCESCLGAEHLRSIPSGEGGWNDVAVIELHLPAHLARLVQLLNGVNRAIHRTPRTLGKQLFK